jgi:MinD superfamily P-loop ATPase
MDANCVREFAFPFNPDDSERQKSLVCRKLPQWQNGFMHGSLRRGKFRETSECSSEHARKTAQETGWKTIIIDGPPGTGCPVISSVTGTNKAIIVTEPTNSGFHDMKRVLEITANFKVKSYVIINKYDLNNRISEKIENWCSENNIRLQAKFHSTSRLSKQWSTAGVLLSGALNQG